MAVIEEAARSVRYRQPEIDSLDFDGELSPSAEVLARTWHELVTEARSTIAVLPAAQAGCCVIDAHGDLYRGPSSSLGQAVAAAAVAFHRGSIRGSFPRVVR